MSGTRPGSERFKPLWGLLRSSQPMPWPAEPPAATGPTVRRRPCVLLVDDEPASLALIAARMETRGFAALQAADGARALELACERAFDLILMDLQMPVLDGLRATAAIRRFEQHLQRPPAPVLAHSANPPAAEVLARYGFSGSLSKPSSDRELEDCLSRWCPAHVAGGAD